MAFVNLPTAQNPAGLTSRQKECLLQIIQGRTDKATAFHMGIAKKTVEHHRQQLYDKLNLRGDMRDTLGLGLAAIYYDYVDLITLLKPLMATREQIKVAKHRH